jgi:HK97 gp10 family phage protein
MKLDFNCDLSAFERDLTKLGVKVSATITARALRAGGEILAEAQRDHAPERTDGFPGGTSLPPGALKADIQTIINIDGEKGVAQVIVGPGYDTDYVANWLEKGHDATGHGKYYINAKGIKKHHKHDEVLGFVEPHPFMKPAFDASAQAALDKAMDVMADGISEELGASSGDDSTADIGGEVETNSDGGTA